MLGLGSLLVALGEVGAPVPVVVGISPSSGDVAGGDHVVIEVDDSTGCVSASVGGIDITGFAIDDGTHVSGDTAAHSAGAVDVTVTNGNGTSSPLVGGFTYASAAADFTTMTLSGLWLGDDYDHTTGVWPSAASAGTSGTGGGTRDFTDISGGLVKPANGSALNGHATVRWDRANSESLRTTGTIGGEFVPTDLHKWGFGILLYVIDVVTNHGGGGSTYTNESYIADFGGFWNVSAYSAGPTFTVGTWPTSSDEAFSTGTWIYLQARGLAGGDTQVRINGGAWSTPVSGGGIGSGIGVLWAGRGNTADYVNAFVAAKWIADYSPPDADFDYSLDAARALSGLSL